MPEAREASPSVHDSLRHVTELLRKHEVVESLVHRSPGPRQDLVETLVHRMHLVELQKQLDTLHPADYDFQAPLGSLGRWLRRSFDCFPRHQGYLKPDPGRVAAYRSRLRERARGASLCVGISWTSANKDFGQDKSTGLADWQGLLRTPGCSFVNLQYGDTAAERAAAEKLAGVRIEHLADLDLYMDLDGLAALCAACDLVITVSNVTVHVAGAVGCPAWLVLPRFNGRLWYWFLDRTDSPWYPSVRIFDQLPGGWRETLDAMAGELAALASRR